ncbi:Trehalose-phosphatase-like protein [Elsinoe fawcettii]|nr:Trehalose-phosphatase-like protein [Elsinoe fawcettii]
MDAEHVDAPVEDSREPHDEPDHVQRTPMADSATTEPETHLQRCLSSDSGASVDTTILSPSLSALSLDNIPSPPRAKLDPTRPILKIRPSDHPTLQLSGRVLSAVFCLPHFFTFTHEEENPWTLHHRPGTAALYESFAFLSGPQTSWKHTLIGWTGEITHRRARKDMTAQMLLLEEYPDYTKETAPMPINGEDRFPEVHERLLKINRMDRTRLEQTLSDDRGIKMLPVWVTDSIDEENDTFIFEDQNKWRGLIEKEFYPLFHYKHPEVVTGEEKIARWNDFVEMNKKFTDRILETYRPGDTIIVHGYELMLVPAMLRSRASDIKVVFVMHTTFPSYEYFRCLSNRDELMEGILSADLVIFQCPTFSENFHLCCKQLQRGHSSSLNQVENPDGRKVTIEVMPLGFDHDAICRFAFGHPTVNLNADKYTRNMKKRGLRLIVGRDRLDSMRGVHQKLQAFALFLAQYPQWQGKAVLFQVLNSPTREEKARGAMQNLTNIEELAHDINGIFGNGSWKPVHLEANMNKVDYFTLVRMAHVGLVTSIREGLSSFALEFALLNRDKHRPLVVSEFSGSATALPGSITINPYDLHQVAKNLDRALSLPFEERAEMYEEINAKLDDNSLQQYTNQLLRRLFLTLEFQSPEVERPALDMHEIKRYSSAARKRLFIFDYDGTLTPIVMDPNAALPSEQLLQHLTELACDSQNTIWIISGRDQEFLVKHLGHIKQLGLSAEHGCFMKYPNQVEWISTAANQDLGWQTKVLETFERLEKHLPGSVVEEKRVSITWHYRRAHNPRSPAVAKVIKKQLMRSVGVEYDVEVMAGKANLEVRPKTINKGQVVRRLLKEFGLGRGSEPDFVLCCGDDTTDEDMFRALRRSDLPMTNVFGVLVGEGSKHPTLASWLVKEPADVINLLGDLLEANKTPTPRIEPPYVIGDPRPRGRPWIMTSYL